MAAWTTKLLEVAVTLNPTLNPKPWYRGRADFVQHGQLAVLKEAFPVFFEKMPVGLYLAGYASEIGHSLLVPRLKSYSYIYIGMGGVLAGGLLAAGTAGVAGAAGAVGVADLLAGGAWSDVVIPLNPDVITAEQWMRRNHIKVVECKGWTADKHAQCVPLPGSNIAIFARGTYGVCNVETCPTTRNILAWAQSAAQCAGYLPPGLAFSDMLPMFCDHPCDFEAAGGCEFYTGKASAKTAGYHDVLRAAHQYGVLVKAALETAGLRVLQVTLSPDVNRCYKSIGEEDSRCLPAHPSGTRGDQGLTAGCIGEFQMMFAELGGACGA